MKSSAVGRSGGDARFDPAGVALDRTGRRSRLRVSLRIDRLALSWEPAVRSKLIVLPCAALAFVAPAVAEPSNTAPPDKPAVAAPTAATSNAAALAATARKFDADVTFMNRTLRVVDSLARYRSWVNMRTGPTGRERIVYGLYAPYDVTEERAAAEKAIAAPPSLPDLDEAMRATIAANDKLAPTLTRADGYYSRGDYKLDHMAEGRALHTAIAADGAAFLAARARLEGVMRVQKLAFDQIRLATIEKGEGRKARWHVGNVMMRGKVALDALDPGGDGRVDVAALDGAMTQFGEAVRGLDDYAAAHPPRAGRLRLVPRRPAVPHAGCAGPAQAHQGRPGARRRPRHDLHPVRMEHDGDHFRPAARDPGPVTPTRRWLPRGRRGAAAG